MSTRPADYAVLIGSIAAAFLAGNLTGNEEARNQIATVCEVQPGAKLAASYQDRSSIQCLYLDTPRPTYGRAVRIKPAVKS